MKRLFLFFLLIGYWSVVRASDTVFIKEAQVPILIERQDNLLFYLRFDARDSRMLDGVTVDLSRCKNLDDIQSVKLYYGGTEARQEEDKNRFAPVSYISSFSPGKTLSAYPSYSIKCAEESNVSESVVLKCNYKLFPGVNFFWVSLQVKPGTSLLSKVTADLSSVTIDGKEAKVRRDSTFKSILTKDQYIQYLEQKVARLEKRAARDSWRERFRAPFMGKDMKQGRLNPLPWSEKNVEK